MGRADPAPMIGPHLFGEQVAKSRSDNRKLAEFDFFCDDENYVAKRLETRCFRTALDFVGHIIK